MNAADHSKFLGVWRIQESGVPAVVLTISDEGGGLSGAILFYMIRRDENQPVRSSPGTPEPLFRIRQKGDTLAFQVSHKRSHGASSAKDKAVHFRLLVKSKGEGMLFNDIASGTPAGYKILQDPPNQ